MTADPVTAAFARSLRRLRAGRELTPPALAELARVDAAVIRNIENGTASTTLATAWRLARALGADPAEMIAGTAAGAGGSSAVPVAGAAVLPPPAFPPETAALWTGPGEPELSRLQVATWTRGRLLRHGYQATASLTAARAGDLTVITRFGDGCLAETRRVLAAHGLSLAGEESAP